MTNALNGQTATNNFGYSVAESDQAMNKALNMAADALEQSNQLGVQTRDWAQKATQKTQEYLRLLEQVMHVRKAGLQVGDVKKTVEEIGNWNKALDKILLLYIRETTNMMNQLKTLNPPLTSAQLRPFIDSIFKDRQLTVQCLDLLVRNKEELEKRALITSQPSRVG